jgi:hypothetical protein
MPITSSLQENETVTVEDPRLFNMNDLARILGVHRNYIRRLKACGFRMPMGRATVAMAHNFIRENAEILGNEPRK